MDNLIKLKDMVTLKKKLLKDKRVLDKEIDALRVKKRKVHDELLSLKEEWKDRLQSSKKLQSKIDTLSSNIREKRANGKRGFRMSGLSIDISKQLDKNIINFFGINVDDGVSRVDIMKYIFSYIRKYDLYVDGDKRYICLKNRTEEVQKLLDIFSIETEDECFRIQRFRSYLEKHINI